MKNLAGKFMVLGCLLLGLVAGSFGAEITCTSPPSSSHAAIEYYVSIAAHDQHLLHIAIRYHASGEMVFQMPVWNALYQVRDFAQYVTDLHATDSHGQPLRLDTLDKTSWRAAAPGGCAIIEYNAFANSAGPFGAEANADHVFLNWAQVLLYAPAQRDAPLALTVSDVPPQWSLHDLGRFDEEAVDGSYHLGQPVTYDLLVDSPVEISQNQLVTFDEDGAHYRLVIDADPADYKLPALEDAVKKVVHAEVDWMQDRPFGEYTILYHFSHGPVGGGMEHSYGTAITMPAERVQANPLAPVSTTAHEFFHLWNVKRIRPQSMVPVDFEHEQYSNALWFCEGVTSAVSELMLVRAGLDDEHGYLGHLSDVISEFESDPARHYQSPEASSVSAWMEGHPYYRRPARSVSYYTSGELLGVLLDLRIRQATHGAKSLRDLFHYLNDQYAKRGLYYDDSSGLQKAAETITGASFEDFFAQYVRGTDDIPYDAFFAWVGLKVERVTTLTSDAGFDASINFSGLPQVTAVTPGSAVEAAGVRVGDTLAAIDDHPYLGDLSTYLQDHKPGESVNFRFTARGGTINVNLVLKPGNQPGFAVVDLPEVTAAQRAQRRAWILGEDAP